MKVANNILSYLIHLWFESICHNVFCLFVYLYICIFSCFIEVNFNVLLMTKTIIEFSQFSPFNNIVVMTFNKG